jgi:hypothetical protein
MMEIRERMIGADLKPRQGLEVKDKMPPGLHAGDKR